MKGNAHFWEYYLEGDGKLQKKGEYGIGWLGHRKGSNEIHSPNSGYSAGGSHLILVLQDKSIPAQQAKNREFAAAGRLALNRKCTFSLEEPAFEYRRNQQSPLAVVDAVLFSGAFGGAPGVARTAGEIDFRLPFHAAHDCEAGLAIGEANSDERVEEAAALEGPFVVDSLAGREGADGAVPSERRETDAINEVALTELVRAAVRLNRKG